MVFFHAPKFRASKRYIASEKTSPFQNSSISRLRSNTLPRTHPRIEGGCGYAHAYPQIDTHTHTHIYARFSGQGVAASGGRVDRRSIRSARIRCSGASWRVAREKSRKTLAVTVSDASAAALCQLPGGRRG